MIDIESRLSVSSATKTPGLEPITWYISDWDQRRKWSVIFNGDVDSDELAIGYLARHIDSLATNVYAIEVSKDGELVTVSSNPRDDSTESPFFPRLQDLRYPWIRTVTRGELRELDRIRPNLDLVSYRHRKAVFKYSFLDSRLSYQRWDELNILIRLSSHPNIIPFHRVVVEKLRGHERIVGFTTQYIAGGSLDVYTQNPEFRLLFKLKWFKQLISTIDDLNYKYGITHQDLAPQNLIIHQATDKILLLDFNFSARIGVRYSLFNEDFNDLKGVIFTLYEIITRKTLLRTTQNTETVLNTPDWVKHPHVKLDRPLAEYRSVLAAWVSSRKERGNLRVYTEATHYMDWPELPRPRRMQYAMPENETGISESNNNHGEDGVSTSRGDEEWEDSRLASRRKGLEVLNWQRPAQGKIKEGMTIFADGTVIDNVPRT